MPEAVHLFAGFVAVTFQAAWLALGASENLRHPAANRTLVTDALAMRRMETLYPDLYAVLKGNRITSPKLASAIFAMIVTAECVVAIVLIAGATALFLALLDIADVTFALTLAILGSTGFSAIWGAFLVGGQWCHYWAGFEDAQRTHLMLLVWGIATTVLLAVA